MIRFFFNLNDTLCDGMAEIELKAEKLTENDNSKNVEMSEDEIWMIKHLMEKYNPKKIVEIGISAGGNTVNLLNWKDDDAQLFSIDIAENWYKDKTKLSGFMADEVENRKNFRIYRGYDYLDVYEEIGDGIDFIVIDTVHVLPGEFLTYILALPQLKDGCVVVLHDIHLNMKKIKNNKFEENETSMHCTGLLYSSISAHEKYSLQTDEISNIGALIVDDATRSEVKDVFRSLCSKWYNFPHNLNLDGYRKYVKEHYPFECYNLFGNCLDFQKKYFKHNAMERKQSLKNKEELESLQMELDSTKKENELIKSTVGWKITKPLRKFRNKLNRKFRF